MKSALSFLLLLFSSSSTAAPSALLGIFKEHSDEASSVVFTPDGRRLITAGDDGNIFIWDVASGKRIGSLIGHEAEIGAAALTRDGKRLISGGDDLSLRVWDVDTGRLISVVSDHHEQTRRLSIAPDDKTVATSSWDGRLKLFDIDSGKLIAALETRETSRVHDVSFSPDGRILLAGQGDKTVRVWDVEKTTEIAAWRGHKNQVTAVAFSPDGKTALSGSKDNTLRLWDASDGRTLAVWHGHTSYVYTIAFSPDGKTAISGGADFTVRRWDVSTGKLLSTWWGHQGALLDLAFSPDGKLAASASEDHTVRLWRVAPGAGAVFADPGETPPAATKAALGEILYFDQRLSGDSSRDCAGCHKPEKYFSDDRPLSLGYPDTLYFRGVPSLVNISERRAFGWKGETFKGGLPAMLDKHLRLPYFMNADVLLLVEKIRQSPDYDESFRRLYGRSVAYPDLLDALSRYLLTLNAAPRPVGKASPAAVLRGRGLFEGKGGCARCHRGPNLSDGKRHDRGVPENKDIYDDPLRSASLRHYLKSAGVKNFADARRDPGPFLTPPLVAAVRTAPYMHNGIFKTLKDAVRFENKKLSSAEIDDVVAYLSFLSPEAPSASPSVPPEYALRPAPAAKKPARSPRPALKKPAAPAALEKPKSPADNPPSEEKVALGKLLFFDHRLSGDGEMQCAACHEPAMGWDDDSDLAQGYERTLHWRNTPTLLNAAHYDSFGWDGQAASLEEWIREELSSNIVMHADPGMVEERLGGSEEYIKRFQRSFGADRPTFDGVILALAAFIRETAVSNDTPFDRYMRGDTAALSKSSLRGFELFKGKAGCIQCHNGAFFTDGAAYAAGVPENPALANVALRQISVRYHYARRGFKPDEIQTEGYDAGKRFATRRVQDDRAFRTPTLRELNHSAPYMHNGVFATLEDVVSFYNEGRGPLPPLGLSEEEISDLVSFLLSLSGPGVVIGQPDKPGRRLSSEEYWK